MKKKVNFLYLLVVIVIILLIVIIVMLFQLLNQDEQNNPLYTQKDDGVIHWKEEQQILYYASCATGAYQTYVEDLNQSLMFKIDFSSDTVTVDGKSAEVEKEVKKLYDDYNLRFSDSLSSKAWKSIDYITIEFKGDGLSAEVEVYDKKGNRIYECHYP